MALPVLTGPYRCELIYNHEKQPLIELSLRVSLPLVELLQTLSQLAPPVGAKESKVQRPPLSPPLVTPSACVHPGPPRLRETCAASPPHKIVEHRRGITLEGSK